MAGGLLAVHLRFGDAFMSWRGYADHAYGGELVAWPFLSLVRTPLAQAVPVWKTAYVFLHVAVVIAGVELARRRLRSSGDAVRPLAGFALTWLALNTAFVRLPCRSRGMGLESPARALSGRPR